MSKITYRKGYKYQLASTVSVHTGIILDSGGLGISCGDYLQINPMSQLTIRAGYAWDGPSGPITVHSKNFMRASLVHDALYQMIRCGKIGANHRIDADNLLREICLADGMSRFRAWYVYRAVRTFGSFALDAREKMTAP